MPACGVSPFRAQVAPIPADASDAWRVHVSPTVSDSASIQPPAPRSAIPDEKEVVAMSASHIVIHSPPGRWVTLMCPVGFSPSTVEGMSLDKPLFARVRYLAG